MAFLLIITFCCMAEAGSSSSLNHYPSKNQPELPDYLPSYKQDKDFTLPPRPEMKNRASRDPLFFLKGVIFEGSTQFSDPVLNKLATPFLNRPITLAELEELRYQVTRLYVDNGYPNSGAFIKPGQKIDDGVITYQIVEGRLNGITISGNGRLRPAYISKRVWPDQKTVFNTNLLQKRFQMLLQDPLIHRMKGRILPGTTPGDALLDLGITRKKPYTFSITADNHSSPGTGAERILMNGTIRNLTGFGDAFALLLGKSRGTNEIDTRFSIPVHYKNTLLSFAYNLSSNQVIEEPLNDIDIENRLENFEVSLNHPVYQSLQRKFELGIAFQTKESKISIFNEPFSSSKEYSDGSSKVSVLRLIQSFQNRSLNRALVLRSTLNLGLDLLESTIHSNGSPDSNPDSKFVSWMGQFQYAHRFGEKFGEKFGQIIFKGNIQLSDDSLLSMEKFSLGGASTVRGYRENELVKDNGYNLSLEWRIPLWKGTLKKETPALLELAPFIDYGVAWDKGKSFNGESFNDNRLQSAGAGLLWTSTRVNAQLYAAHGFKEMTTEAEHNLQDHGIHFSISIKY